MRRNLVNTKQIFGKVDDSRKLPATMKNARPMGDKPLGGNPVGNTGFNHSVPIHANPNANAEAEASRYHSDPFHWTGRARRG